MSAGERPRGKSELEDAMDRRTFLKTLPAVAALARSASSFAEEASGPAPELHPIALLKPETDGGKSVLAALKERKTTRDISDKKLPEQVLSNLLWAAFGVNRESGPRGQVGRTAASASNSQEIDLYVVLAEGIYLYDATPHRLVPVVAGDQRAKLGRRGRGGAGARAPVNLVFVADIAKYGKAPFQEPGLRDPEIQKSYYNVATGLIAGNVYLFAASQGLAAWFRNCDKETLAKDLKLRPEQRVLYAQTVGYPA
jgi:nitroreductase